MKWISVEDRLPECSGDYIIKTDEADDAVYSAFYRWSKEEWIQIGTIKDRVFGTVTHWRKFPKPPKKHK